jgi:murein L,D-transpeptidase YafK
MRDAFIATIAMLLAVSGVQGTDVPSSARSRAAIERVRPNLEAELRAKGLEFGAAIFIRVFKASQALEVWVEQADEFVLFKTYDICTYSGDLGPKLRTGDRQSPEGFYFVPPDRLNPWSRFHLSFNLGFPNAYDRAHGRTGSYLMIHGDCVSIGCYAMTDPAIEEIYALADGALRNGQPFFRVHIFPFRMTEANLKSHRSSRWADFWRNLKKGYEWFERTRRPPDVEVENGRYVFESS